MEKVWIDNPKKATTSHRLIAGGIGLAVGATIGCVVYRGHIKFHSKTIITTSIILGLAAVGLTYLTNPPKKLVEAQK